MTKSKARGTAFESLMIPVFDKHFPGTERRALQGALDKGDLLLPGNREYITELKNCKRLELSAWAEEARKEAANAGVPGWMVVFKRPRVGDPFRQFCLTEIGWNLEMIHRDG